MENMDFNPDYLYQALADKSVKKIREIFEEYNPVDIAEALERLDDLPDYIFIFKVVPPQYTAEVFSYLDSDVKEKIIAAMTSDQISQILENLFVDDIVDFVEEMPSNLTQKILQSATKETRSDINHLLNYRPDSAGSIMTVEYVELKKEDTAEEALAKVRKFGKEAETISYLFVVDNKRTLVGTLRLRDVIFANPKETIDNLMEHDFVSVFTYDDQEEVANIVKRYDLNAIPVTTKDFRLVGIITADDIIDVIDEEASEDIQKMGAVSPLGEEYLKISVLRMVRKRIPWLFILMISATITGLIINSYEEVLQHLPALSMFIPMLMDTAGNSGGQASVLIIRGLALGEVTTKDYLQVLRKEIGVALIAGLCLAMFNFVWIIGQAKIGMISISSSVSLYRVAALVATTLGSTVVIAKTVGATLPMIAKKLNFDPALMAGPLVTTIVDGLALMVYFLLATRIFMLI